MLRGVRRENLEIDAERIQDPEAQEAVDRIRVFLETQPFLRFDGRFYEIVFTAAVSNFKFSHGLGFVPKDVWITSSVGAGAATINHASNSSESLDITTTGAVTIRIFAGSTLDLP